MECDRHILFVHVLHYLGAPLDLGQTDPVAPPVSGTAPRLCRVKVMESYQEHGCSQGFQEGKYMYMDVWYVCMYA